MTHEPLTWAWREAHTRAGDDHLGHAERLASEGGNTQRGMLLAAIASAHYQAANIRTRPITPMPPANTTLPI